MILNELLSGTGWWLVDPAVIGRVLFIMPRFNTNPPEIEDKFISKKRVVDPHHPEMEWGWSELHQQLYQRGMRSGRWRIANKVHITPARVEKLHYLINN